MNFYTSIALTLLVASIVGFIMLKIQKRREQDADDRFELTMKSHGLSTEIEEPKHEMVHAEVAMLDDSGRIPVSELPDYIEVRDENFDMDLLGKVQKKKPRKKAVKKKTSKKVTKKKKSTKKRK